MKTDLTILKAIICTVVAIILFNISYIKAQAIFNGDWSGKVTISEGNELWVRIKISSGTVTQYFYDNEEKEWQPVSPVLARFNYNKNNFLYYWMNNSVIWSETQSFMLSYVSYNSLYIVWSRQVNNKKENEDNNVWCLQGMGYLTRRD